MKMVAYIAAYNWIGTTNKDIWTLACSNKSSRYCKYSAMTCPNANSISPTMHHQKYMAQPPKTYYQKAFPNPLAMSASNRSNRLWALSSTIPGQ